VELNLAVVTLNLIVMTLNVTSQRGLESAVTRKCQIQNKLHLVSVHLNRAPNLTLVKVSNTFLLFSRVSYAATALFSSDQVDFLLSIDHSLTYQPTQKSLRSDD